MFDTENGKIFPANTSYSIFHPKKIMNCLPTKIFLLTKSATNIFLRLALRGGRTPRPPVPESASGSRPRF